MHRIGLRSAAVRYDSARDGISDLWAVTNRNRA